MCSWVLDEGQIGPGKVESLGSLFPFLPMDGFLVLERLAVFSFSVKAITKWTVAIRKFWKIIILKSNR